MTLVRFQFATRHEAVRFCWEARKVGFRLHREHLHVDWWTDAAPARIEQAFRHLPGGYQLSTEYGIPGGAR